MRGAARIIERVKRAHLILIGIAVWTVIALYFASQAYLNPALRYKPRLADVLQVNLVYYYLWGLSTPVVIWLGRRFPIPSKRWKRSLGVHILASLLLTAAQIVIAESILSTFSKALYRTEGFANNLQTAFRINFHGSLPTYWLILAVYLAAVYYRNAMRLESQLSRAQLDALKMQLNPHFLFNTLNSISSLMYTDVDAADAMLARLSEFLRLTLDLPPEQEIALEEEMDFVRRYLEIERIRFEERLHVDIDMERGTERALVPSLALQPLVENAIHHGIARNSAGGSIEIRARRDEEFLRVTVRNGGGQAIPPVRTGKIAGPPQEVREGIGLANTRARLKSLYGERHRFTYGVYDGGFEVEMLIPCFAR
ncbi:MAG: histidine kinase [Acidobacteria bacterium]|nr:MAG: histidine kinase [Acidobacteriota bacterium]